MVSTSYPGVYVQEVSSGVRTIAGVGTSIALFLGRTGMGELNRPVQCLSYEDYTRAFGAECAGSDMARAVKLFFSNGGTTCAAMRIAKGANASTLMLLNEAKGASLKVEARSAGSFGDDIRLAVSYNTLTPEATFNLELFRWQKSSSGVQQKTMAESYAGLSMDPRHPRYVVDMINQSSALIRVSSLAGTPAASGYSQSGYAVSARTDTIARTQWSSLIGKNAAGNRFRIAVDGNAPVEVDLSSIDFGVAPLDTPSGCAANLPLAIAQLINDKLPAGCSVTASMQAGPAGPTGQDNLATQYLRIASANGDVRIESSPGADLAAPLMLGTANGGLESSRYGDSRPAPTGYVMTLADVAAFAAMRQDSFNKLRVDAGFEIDLSVAPFKIATSPASITEARMYQDASASGQNDGRRGLREKLAIIAAAINAKRITDSSFCYGAELWGDRLAIIPLSGSDNLKPVVARLNGGAVVAPPLKADTSVNVRHYALGSVGVSPYQAGGAAGNPGIAPQAAEYEAAYSVIDRELDLFNLLVLPRDADHGEADTRKLWGPASLFCQKRRAFLLMDPPASWTDTQKAVDAATGVNSLRIGLVKDHAAVFYPNLKIDENGREVMVGPCGAIAGVMARIDATRGVWKAPAGTEADLRGVTGVQYRFSDGENGVLNPRAINTIRVFPNGIVSWGARTMDGDDAFGSEYKYLPVRRLALFLEESLYRGLKWAVFEPNDEPLWSQIRLNVGAFMHNQFRQGAFQGATPREAYFVKCDASTTTQHDRNLGIVNIMVGFAPLKPAEFVVLYLQQMAGQIQV